MTIEYLAFVCFMGRLLLDHSASSYSSFMKSSFLIQMIRWIRGSLRIEFFTFLIAWGIFFEWWELDLQLLPSSSSLLMSRASSSSQSLLKLINSFWNTFLTWMNSLSWEAIQDGYHYFCILHFFFYRLKLFCILDLHILQLFSQSHFLIYVLPFK